MSTLSGTTGASPIEYEIKFEEGTTGATETFLAEAFKAAFKAGASKEIQSMTCRERSLCFAP